MWKTILQFRYLSPIVYFISFCTLCFLISDLKMNAKIVFDYQSSFLIVFFYFLYKLSFNLKKKNNSFFFFKCRNLKFSKFLYFLHILQDK